MVKANKDSYDLAVQLFQEHIDGGWAIEAAAADACISYRLNLKEQEKIWKKVERM